MKIENINEYRIFRYFKEGTSILHREDGPAVEYDNGTKFWYKDGKLYRENGPAIEYDNGTKFWYKEGKLHREDGPAIEYADGDKAYWLNGKHLEDIKNDLELIIKVLLE